MKTSKSYNGYANYNQWNQSLWINNDEGLYSLAREAVQVRASRKDAVDYFYDALMESENYKTPDGIKWSKAGIRAAMVGM